MSSTKNVVIAKSVGIAFIIAEIIIVKYLTTKSSTWFESKAPVLELTVVTEAA